MNMSDPQQIEKDLREYLEREPNLRREDRLTYLTTIFNKHLDINKLEHVVNYKDFLNIVSFAKTRMSNMKLPVRLTNRQLETSEATHLAIIDSFISYLNKNSLLKKFIKFDHTDYSE